MEGHAKLSIRHPAKLAWLALLLAAAAMLMLASGAQAAPKLGVVLVKDIRPGHSGAIQGVLPGRGGGVVPQLANDSGTLYFSADDGRHGHELWRSDGSRKGTRMVRDINPGPAGSVGIIPSSSGTPLYFFADDGVHGAELWRTDGTAAGTSLVKDLFPGPTSSLSTGGVGGELINLGGTLYFSYAGFPKPQNQGLYRSDGTDAGTTLVKKMGVGALTDFNGTLYFGGAGDDPTFKIGLWRSDGTAAGTTNVKEGVVPSEFVNADGTMYIDDGYRDLWRSDGTEAGTAMVKTIAPAGAIQDLTAVDGAVYFLASSGCCNSPDELWRSDGTEAGTTIVKYLNVEPGYGFDLTAFRGKLYFTAGGWLWRSDGTPQGTTVVKGNCSPKAGARTRCFSGLMATGPNGPLYLVGSDKRYGGELWRSNGIRKGTRIVSDIRPGRDTSLPMYLTAVNRTLFFTANDGRHGRELWKVAPKPCKAANGKCKKG
jgi:ELWxxDGT repeat protein